MDVVVNAKFKDSMYYQWAMWMMNGPRKVQPKSGNFIAADFTTILSWCTYAWKEVKRETILSGVKKCYMSSDPGPEFDVEAAPEKMEVEKKAAKKPKKKIVAGKSKSPAEMERLAKKKERAGKRRKGMRRSCRRHRKQKRNRSEGNQSGKQPRRRKS